MSDNIDYIEHLLYEVNSHKKELDFYKNKLNKELKKLTEEEKSKLRFIHGDDILE